MRQDLPTGTVTFLFTDVEGSTRLLRQFGPERYAQALADHRRVLRDAFVAEGGVEVDTQGDASSSLSRPLLGPPPRRGWGSGRSRQVRSRCGWACIPEPRLWPLTATSGSTSI